MNLYELLVSQASEDVAKKIDEILRITKNVTVNELIGGGDVLSTDDRVDSFTITTTEEFSDNKAEQKIVTTIYTIIIPNLNDSAGTRIYPRILSGGSDVTITKATVTSIVKSTSVSNSMRTETIHNGGDTQPNSFVAQDIKLGSNGKLEQSITA